MNDTEMITDIIEPNIYLYLEIYIFLKKLSEFIEIIYEKIPKDSIIIERKEEFKLLVNQCFDDTKQQLNELLADIEKKNSSKNYFIRIRLNNSTSW